MIRQFRNRAGMRLVAGLVLGLLVSGLLSLAALERLGYFDAARLRELETHLHAAAAQSGAAMAVATGPIEPGVEGLFVLDFISGDLTCGVLNPRSGKLAGLFKRNVAADLGVEQGKQPKYLLVTGALEIKGQVSNIRPALSLVYVADSNTGRYVGYALPWNQQGINQNVTQVQTMVPIGSGSARNIVIE